jgi:L-ascorbate 6-phosphate lactonase
MAEVARSGAELLTEISDTAPGEGTGVFWWLGQHSFVLRLGGTTLYIDPYLEPSPARQTPPLFAPEAVANADLVLCTHDHSDHIDPVALSGIVRASPQAVFVAPRPHRERMLGIGIPEERLRLLTDGEELLLSGVRVTGIKAKHEFFEEGPLGFPFLGYVIEGSGVTCYHSGDTLVYEGLLTALRRWKLDAAFLPINGRDAQRYRSGCIGNMTYQEAADLAGELQVGLAVPSHWDMFAGNSEDPRKFVDFLRVKFPDVPAWVGKAGERVVFGAMG